MYIFPYSLLLSFAIREEKAFLCFLEFSVVSVVIRNEFYLFLPHMQRSTNRVSITGSMEDIQRYLDQIQVSSIASEVKGGLLPRYEKPFHWGKIAHEERSRKRW